MKLRQYFPKGVTQKSRMIIKEFENILFSQRAPVINMAAMWFIQFIQIKRERTYNNYLLQRSLTFVQNVTVR